MENKKKPIKNTYFTIGAGLGLTFGMIFDNLAIGLSLGTALGLLVDVYINKKAESNS